MSAASAQATQAARASALENFLRAEGWARAERSLLAGDASFRRYDRLIAKDRRAVLMDAPPPQENVGPFIEVAQLLTGLGFSAPKIFAADRALGFLLLEDLGDDTYTRLLQRGAEEGELYRLATDLLVALQQRIGPSGLAPRPALDDARALREVSLLLDWWWPTATGESVDPAARDSYIAIWSAALPRGRRAPLGLALFDYHVDNLLYLPDRPGVAACGLLDFQDALQAPMGFDLMSLIQDARRDLRPGLGAELYDRFRAGFPDLDGDAFADAYAVFGAERHARIIGTFARLWKRDGKPGYLKFLPRVWRQLEEAMRRPCLAPLEDWFHRHVPAELRSALEPRP